MKTYSIEFYLYCLWEHFPPTYRLYCDGNLMTERTYIWDNKEHVLQERLPIITASDKATIRIEQVGQQTGDFSVKKIATDPPGLDITVEIV